MLTMYYLHRVALLLAVVAATDFAHAQQVVDTFKPEVGQDGKDVVWVPTADTVVETMLDMAKVTSEDYVIDLGSGDGKTVIAAARRGARALGIEYNPKMVELSERNAAKAGVSDQVRFVQGDLFECDLSQATVITMFLLPEINLKLRPKLLELKPGTRIVSNTFNMGDWKPDKRVKITEDCADYCKALLWIVPAKVTGIWQIPEGQLALQQSFQNVSGTLTRGTTSNSILDGRLSGNRLKFRVGDSQFNGAIDGDSIQGTTRAKWTARKQARIRSTSAITP